MGAAFGRVLYLVGEETDSAGVNRDQATGWLGVFTEARRKWNSANFAMTEFSKKFAPGWERWHHPRSG